MPELDLPPPFRAVALREARDALAHAVAVADTEGAGTLVHVGRFDVAEFALVLEPEETLRTARRVFYAGMLALADALAAHAPPEKPISFEWPDAIRVDGGLVGGGRFAWPAAAAEDEIPSWLVFGATIRTVAMGEEEAGGRALGTALEEEGFDDIGSGRLVKSFARHFMVALDAWHEQGFGEIAKNYLARLSQENGVGRDIAENGDLMLHLGASKPERRSFIGALMRPSWLDSSTGAPRPQTSTPP
jgi:biotin-(acetyl-CoA carboxylase) ligase